MKRTFFLIASVLLLSCAHQISPGGGPEDKTGPYVLSTTPAFGTVNAKPTGSVTVAFSKWITPASAIKSVIVLPALDGGFRVHVSTHRLIIIPRKRFADSTTYHIVVTSALQDFHNNPMAGSFSLVFSTGPTLDSGSVAGCVNDTTRKPVQAIAGLYSLKGNAVPDSTPFGTPDYLTQTDSAGFFSFGNIRNGTYRLVAFIDQNNNRRLDPGVDRAFAPLLQTVKVSPLADTFPLYPVETDTATPHLTAVKVLWSGAMQCKWSKPLDSAQGYSEPRWTIEAADGKSKPVQVREVLWLGARDRCILSLDPPLNLGTYHVLASFSKQREAGSVMVNDTLRFNGVSGPDTTKPVFVSSNPPRLMSLSPEIRMVFSKPVEPNGPLTLTDSLKGEVQLKSTAGYNDTVILTAEKHIRPSDLYHLSITKNSFKDLAGNDLKPRDSLSDTVAALTFPTIEADSLAVSLKGCAPCLGHDARRAWIFLPFSGVPTTCQDKDGCFEFDSIPSGKGQIEYFIDANGNGRRDAGSLVPWIPPEPFSRMPDTIEARARWEIEGVNLAQPCRRCAPAPARQDTSLTPRPLHPIRPASKHPLEVNDTGKSNISVKK